MPADGTQWQPRLPLDEHGHDYVDVADTLGGGEGPEDARAGGAGSFQGDHTVAQDAEDLCKIFAVEGDLRRVTLDGGGDLTLVVADFLGAGGDGQTADTVLFARSEGPTTRDLRSAAIHRAKIDAARVALANSPTSTVVLETCSLGTSWL